MIEAKKHNITYYNTKLNQESNGFEEAGSTYRNRSFTIELQENRQKTENKSRLALVKEKLCSINSSKNEDIYESVYLTNKRKEIYEGKRRKSNICFSSNANSIYS